MGRQISFGCGYVYLSKCSHVFNLTVIVPCLTPPLPTVTVPWRSTSGPPSLMTDLHPSSTSDLLSPFCPLMGPFEGEKEKWLILTGVICMMLSQEGPEV